MAKSTCGGCGKVFSSLSSFDMHRVGSYGDPIIEKGHVIGYTPTARRCLSAQEMRDKGMLLNERGVWTTGFDATGIWGKVDNDVCVQEDQEIA
jgi:hypothetical protein